MNWLMKIAELPLRITEECTGYHHGQTNCLISAYLEDRFVGSLAFALFRGNTHIRHVEVVKDMRRMGIATQLYRKLEEVKEGEIIHSMQTPNGADWVNSL